MNPQHKSLAQGRWHNMPLMEQLGNIGSEVERVIRWREKGNQEYAMRALDRALELFDLTVSDPGNRKRLREICRAREVLLDFVVGENEYNSSAEYLRRYYLEFGVAAQTLRAKS